MSNQVLYNGPDDLQTKDFLMPFFLLLIFPLFWNLACTLMVSIEQVVILSGVVFTDFYCQFILGAFRGEERAHQILILLKNIFYSLFYSRRDLG